MLGDISNKCVSVVNDDYCTRSPNTTIHSVIIMVTFFIDKLLVWWIRIAEAACIKTLLERGITVLHVDHHYLLFKIGITLDIRLSAVHDGYSLRFGSENHGF